VNKLHVSLNQQQIRKQKDLEKQILIQKGRKKREVVVSPVKWDSIFEVDIMPQEAQKLTQQDVTLEDIDNPIEKNTEIWINPINLSLVTKETKELLIKDKSCQSIKESKKSKKSKKVDKNTKLKNKSSNISKPFSQVKNNIKKLKLQKKSKKLAPNDIIGSKDADHNKQLSLSETAPKVPKTTKKQSKKAPKKKRDKKEKVKRDGSSTQRGHGGQNRSNSVEGNQLLFIISS